MQFLSEEKGQGMVEYSLILVVVAVLVMVLLALLGQYIVSTYQFIVDQLSLI